MALTRSHSSAHPVEAAGAVLWRPGPDGPQLALIHRPRYGDWSFPKGKMDPGEHIQLTALREVHEETGHQVLLGRRLLAVSYPLADGAVKRVRYWAARPAAPGDAVRFVPNHEVDRLAWLTPAEAGDRLTRRLDGSVLASFLAAPVDTIPIVLLRHGTPERRSKAYADDRLRPLSTQGQTQAQAMTDLLACFGRTRIISAPAIRCVDTVRPFAGRQRMIIDIDPALSEAAHAAAPRAAASWIRALIAESTPTVVCSHAEVLDSLLAAALAHVPTGKAAAAPRTRLAVSRAHAGMDGQLDAPPLVNGRPWSRREADRLLGSGGSGGAGGSHGAGDRLAPGRAWVLHVTPSQGPRYQPKLVAIDRLRP